MGFSVDTLENVRCFFLTYQDRISETVFRKFTVKKSQTVFEELDKEQPFIVSWSHYLQFIERTDIIQVTGDSLTAAGNLINKMKEAGIIESVIGHGKGKYRFKV